MDTQALIDQLKRDQYDERQISSPGGRVLAGEDRAFDLGYRKGWNDAQRALIAQLQQGSIEAGLEELRRVEPVMLRSLDGEPSAAIVTYSVEGRVVASVVEGTPAADQWQRWYDENCGPFLDDAEDK